MQFCAMHQTITSPVSLVDHLECSSCKKHYPLNTLQTYAPCCTKPLVAKYDFALSFQTSDLVGRPNTMWRYQEVLPVLNQENIVSLGEGMTPILDLAKSARKLGLHTLKMKDESLNPTGSFKARGLSMAISKAKELGVKHCVIPTAGNAGGAMSAYCAAADIRSTVIMPRHTPKMFQDECRHYGAELILLDGLIDKCGVLAAQFEREQGAFNISTLKEPYRLEGKKTMGYELVEQLNWNLPDVILYPTGGGTGLLGIWKAFQEMIELGWLDSGAKLPRMIVVQSENCSPVIDALQGNRKHPSTYLPSLANGLAVPVAFGEDMILEVIRESKGCSVKVSEGEMVEGVQEMARNEGILIAPEGAALLKAIPKLRAQGQISSDDSVLMINTGSGYKYLEHLN